jgi:arylsulfatase A-like enzyme
MSADDVNARACDWLGRWDPTGGPFFLYLHYLEPHNQYRPPSRFCVFGRPGYTAHDDIINTEMNLVPDGVPGHRVTDEVLVRQGRSRADVERLSDLYDGEALCVDHYIGELVETLQERGVYDNTIIIVTADHGEAFLEHEYLEHGASLHQEVIRVPLIARGPGIPAGEKVEALVELVDIAPTVLDWVVVGATPPLSGRSFRAALAQGSGSEDEIGLAEIPQTGTYALRQGSMKLIAAQHRTELYDLSIDPCETTDLASSRPDEVTRLRRVLDDLLEKRRATVTEMGPSSPDEIEALKALGYL